MSSRNQGQESSSLLQILLKVSEGLKGSDVQADSNVRMKAWIVFALMRKQRSCVLMAQMLRVSGWAPGTTTTAAQYQLLPLPAASLSWNQLRSWHVDWETEKNTRLQPGASARGQYFHMQRLLQRVKSVFERWMPAQKHPDTMQLPTPK